MIVYFNDTILFTKLPLIKQAFKYYVKFVSTFYDCLTCNENYKKEIAYYMIYWTLWFIPDLSYYLSFTDTYNGIYRKINGFFSFWFTESQKSNILVVWPEICFALYKCFKIQYSTVKLL